MACAVDSDSIRKTAILEDMAFARTSFSSSVLRDKRPESRWIMGHSVVAMPRRVSTLLRGDVVTAPSGGKGRRHPGAGATESGAVPFDRAAITS